MRSLVIVAIGIVVLSQSASAQTQFERQVRTQLDSVGQTLAKKGFELTTQIHTGELEKERNEEVTLRLRAGVRYAIVGVCDQDCKDLDIVLYNSSGRELANDVGEDDVPVVELTPEREGNYIVRVVMANCSNEPCHYGLGLYSSVGRSLRTPGPAAARYRGAEAREERIRADAPGSHRRAAPGSAGRSQGRARSRPRLRDRRRVRQRLQRRGPETLRPARARDRQRRAARRLPRRRPSSPSGPTSTPCGRSWPRAPRRPAGTASACSRADGIRITRATAIRSSHPRRSDRAAGRA